MQEDGLKCKSIFEVGSAGDWWPEDGAGRLPQGVKHRLMGKALSSRL